MIKWEELDLPEFEDEAATKVRLDEIHRAMLAEKGLSTTPNKNSPGFAPTPYQSRQVSVMAALGLEAKDIALVLDVDERLVKNYYHKELKVSHNLANMMVAKVALQMAMSGRFPDMTKFWLKSRGGWKEQVASAYDGGKGPEGDIGSAKDRLRRMVGSNLKPEVKVKP